MARAFGLAGSQAAGTFAAWGTPTVKFHQCRGALSGLMAAILAAQEFVATREFLTAKDGGLYNTYVDGGKPALAIEGLGQRWELEQIGLRPWPSGSPMQGINTVLFDLIEQNDVDPDTVRKARIRVSPSVFDMHGKLPHYNRKVRGADLGALHGGCNFARQGAVAAPIRACPIRRSGPARGCRRSRSRSSPIRVCRACRPRPKSSIVDGTKLSGRCDHPRGSYENPLSSAQLKSKFQTYVSKFKSDGQSLKILDAIDGLENLASVRSLMDLLRSTPQAASS